MTVNAVIATTPQGMVEAQGAVTKWIDARIEHWNQTLGEAEGLPLTFFVAWWLDERDI